MAMRCHSLRLLEPALCSLRHASVPLFYGRALGLQSGTKMHHNIIFFFCLSRWLHNVVLFLKRENAALNSSGGDVCRKYKASGCNSLNLNSSGQP